MASRYYSKLQPILNNIDGFLEELPFSDPTRADTSMLYARFRDEEALTQWRNNQTHLRIMHHARQKMYDSFHVTIGTDAIPSESSVPAKELLVYQRPKTQELDEPIPLSQIVKDSGLEQIAESEYYVGDTVVWVLRVKAGASASELKDALVRVPGDSAQRGYVVREYTKEDRRRAPEGIDKAEAGA